MAINKISQLQRVLLNPGAEYRSAPLLGMELWIYDEDKWPSGSAGGMVSGTDREAFTAKCPSPAILFWWVCKITFSIC